MPQPSAPTLAQDTRGFFQELTPFFNFLDFTEKTHYARAPRDWHLVISDVRGSTKAIESGKYKIVNMVGASAIAAICNTMKTLQVPMVFGGDGATALVPGAALQDVMAAMRSVQRQSLTNFELELRVGAVPIMDLEDKGHHVEVAKYTLPGGPSLAFFRGSGFDLAETWVKDGNYQINEGPEAPIDEVLSGLSCRWAPIRNTRGTILTLLIKAANHTDQDQILKRAANHINHVVDFSLPATHPVKTEGLRAEDRIRAAQIEGGLTTAKNGWIHKVKIATQMAIMATARRLGSAAPKGTIRTYLEDQPTHSDFCKFDDSLRMVIDCSEQMVGDIQSFLESERKLGKLFYGYNLSPSALLTCYVQGLNRGNHIHFVDGSDGGYAVAAKMLKKQIRER